MSLIGEKNVKKSMSVWLVFANLMMIPTFATATPPPSPKMATLPLAPKPLTVQTSPHVERESSAKIFINNSNNSVTEFKFKKGFHDDKLKVRQYLNGYHQYTFFLDNLKDYT